jgi:glucose/arabinose dehydrogenase
VDGEILMFRSDQPRFNSMMHDTKTHLVQAAAGLIALLASAPPVAAQAIATELIVSGLSTSVWLGAPPNDLERLFIVERRGLIQIFKDGQVLPTPFLDVDALTNGAGERGLLGMAFHPDYASNGRFFINYTTLSGDTRVVEYRVSADPDVADPMPRKTIFAAVQPFSNHNGGNLAFGPDGKLYIGTGDGGSANDPGNRAQNGSSNLGKMIRLDVDIPRPFIPADNPFVGNPQVNDEIWALGLRNPWRYTFDRATGDLYIADVGQGSREEISFQPASSLGGENYGWRCMEGTACTGLSGCTCNDIALTPPFQSPDSVLGRTAAHRLGRSTRAAHSCTIRYVLDRPAATRHLAAQASCRAG